MRYTGDTFTTDKCICHWNFAKPGTNLEKFVKVLKCYIYIYYAYILYILYTYIYTYIYIYIYIYHFSNY